MTMTDDGIRSGNLREIALTDLLRNLLTSRVTGVLSLEHNDEKKSVYIRNGAIVFATSNRVEDRLGNILVRAGKLSQKQVEAALKFKGATQRKFGAIIVELGFLTPKELFDGLKLQVKEVIYSLFCWEDGAYSFTAGELPPEVIPLNLDPVQLLTEIITRLQEDVGS